MTVSVYQTRSDMPLDKIEIQVHNVTSEPVTVERAQLRSIDSSPRRRGTSRSRSRAGAAVDLKVQMPAASCLPDPRDQVVVSVRPTMARRTSHLCRRIRWGNSTSTAPRDASKGMLRPPPRSTLRVCVAIDCKFWWTGSGANWCHGNDHPVPAAESGALRAGGRQAGLRQVVLRPNRCDAHALAEDKQGTYFPVSVTLPDGRSGDYTMTVDQQTRVGLYRCSRKQCGLS